MTAWIWIWRIWIFSKKFHGIVIFSNDPLEEKKFYLTYTSKSKVEIWTMCVQLDLEVTCKRPPQEMEYHLFFRNFEVKKWNVKSTKKKKLWCLNLIILWIPWNDRLPFLEVNLQQVNPKILRLLLQVLILWFKKKLISSTRLKTTRIW
jgi:hypothetical protein